MTSVRQDFGAAPRFNSARPQTAFLLFLTGSAGRSFTNTLAGQPARYNIIGQRLILGSARSLDNAPSAVYILQSKTTR
jgi:hypothetical protein